jgi:hypothetical protein
MSAPRTGTPIVLSSLAIAAMLSAAVVGCTRQPAGSPSAADAPARVAGR